MYVFRCFAVFSEFAFEWRTKAISDQILSSNIDTKFQDDEIVRTICQQKNLHFFPSTKKKVRYNSLLLRMNQKLKCIFIEREIFFLLRFSHFVRYEKFVHKTEHKIIRMIRLKWSNILSKIKSGALRSNSNEITVLPKRNIKKKCVKTRKKIVEKNSIVKLKRHYGARQETGIIDSLSKNATVRCRTHFLLNFRVLISGRRTSCASNALWVY